MLGSDSVFEWVVSGIQWIRGIAGNGLGGDSSDSKILPRRSCSAGGSLSARFSRWRVGGGRERTGRKISPGGGIQSKPFSAQYSYLRNEHHHSAAPPLVLQALNSALGPVDGLRASRRKGGPSESSGNGSHSERVGAGGGSCERVELRL